MHPSAPGWTDSNLSKAPATSETPVGEVIRFDELSSFIEHDGHYDVSWRCGSLLLEQWQLALGTAGHWKYVCERGVLVCTVMHGCPQSVARRTTHVLCGVLLRATTTAHRNILGSAKKKTTTMALPLLTATSSPMVSVPSVCHQCHYTETATNHYFATPRPPPIAPCPPLPPMHATPCHATHQLPTPSCYFLHLILVRNGV